MSIQTERPSWASPASALDAVNAIQQITDWRAQGAQALDPVAFHHLETLASRAAAYTGATRDWLDRRLHTLLAAYGTRLAAAPAPGDVPTPQPRPRSGLQGLLDALAHPMPGDTPVAETVSGKAGNPDRVSTASTAATYAAASSAARPELKALRDHKRTWSRLRVEQRMTRSLAQRPGNAGPLNSHGLVLRALQQMQELSPDYLDRFMAHIETLQWLEKATGGPAAGPRDVLRSEAGKAEAPARPAPQAGKRRKTARGKSD